MNAPAWFALVWVGLLTVAAAAARRAERRRCHALSRARHPAGRRQQPRTLVNQKSR